MKITGGWFNHNRPWVVQPPLGTFAAVGWLLRLCSSFDVFKRILSRKISSSSSSSRLHYCGHTYKLLATTAGFQKCHILQNMIFNGLQIGLTFSSLFGNTMFTCSDWNKLHLHQWIQIVFKWVQFELFDTLYLQVLLLVQSSDFCFPFWMFGVTMYPHKYAYCISVLGFSV